MFPLNSNDQYIDENGKRSSLGDLFEGSEHDIEELEETVVRHATKIGALETLTGALQDQINPDEYSATESYTAGDYVIHDNVLYKCNTSCAADTWTNNSQYFTATNVADELTAINSDLNELFVTTVDTITTNLSNSSWATASKTVSKDGYSPIGIVGFNSQYTNYLISQIILDGNTLRVSTNSADNQPATISVDINVTILWKKNIS